MRLVYVVKQWNMIELLQKTNGQLVAYIWPFKVSIKPDKQINYMLMQAN